MGRAASGQAGPGPHVGPSSLLAAGLLLRGRFPGRFPGRASPQRRWAATICGHAWPLWREVLCLGTLRSVLLLQDYGRPTWKPSSALDVLTGQFLSALGDAQGHGPRAPGGGHGLPGGEPRAVRGARGARARLSWVFTALLVLPGNVAVNKPALPREGSFLTLSCESSSAELSGCRGSACRGFQVLPLVRRPGCPRLWFGIIPALGVRTPRRAAAGFGLPFGDF